MVAAVEAVRKAGAERIVVAVPTAHGNAARRLAEAADALHCPNIRVGAQFAVADAYRRWADVSEERALALLAVFWNHCSNGR